MNHQTLSLCIPSTCISFKSCRSQNHATYIAHQISRAAVLYGVTEIIIYDIPEEEVSSQENNKEASDQPKKVKFDDDDIGSGVDAKIKHKVQASDNSIRLANLLQYFVTPSYLRKSIFEHSKEFQYAKKLPKLPGLPFQNHKSSRFLEGVTVRSGIAKSGKKKKGKKSKKQLELEATTEFVNVGLDEFIKLEDQKLPTNTRVTVDIEERKTVSPFQAYNSVLSSFTPFKTQSFGYSVRVAPSFGSIFMESIFPQGYSFTAYVPCEEFTLKEFTDTSSNIKQIEPELLSQQKTSSQNLLLIFGIWKEIVRTVKMDSELGDTEAFRLFDGRLACQRGVRTEDTVLISLAQISMILH